jgi:hypothetical protein
MAKRTYEQKLNNVNTWVKIINHYWHALESNLHNNKEFWDNTLHSMQDEDWWDMIEVYNIVKQTHSDEFYRFPKMHEDMRDIEKKLMLGKAVIRPNQQTANKTGFRAWMVLKDVLNNINGTPTVNYNTEEKPNSASQTPFERLFEI